MSIKKIKLYHLSALLLALLMAGSQVSCSALEAMKSQDQDDVIYVANVGPQDYIAASGFQNGLEMARDEINESGLLQGGRRLELVDYDDQADLTRGMKIAQQIVEEGKYTAVIGHWNASVALPTTRIYEEGGELVLSPAVSNVKLTEAGYQNIFRLVPSDQDEISRIMEYIRNQGYDRLAVVYADNAYGLGLVELLTQTCKAEGITIVDIHRNFINQVEFEQQYRKWQALDTRAVFIADSLSTGGEAIRLIRSQSSEMPVLSVGGFSFDDVNAMLGGDGDNISYIDPYYHEQSDPIQTFQDRYRQKYGEDPGQFSLEAYDILHILAQAIEEAQSADPAVVSQVLKSGREWKSTVGNVHFDQNGNIMGCKLTLVELKKGQYRYLPQRGEGQ